MINDALYIAADLGAGSGRVCLVGVAPGELLVEEIFERTGIQFLVFNTLFQLYAHAQAGIPKAAAHLLLIPDLINFFLTGRATTEYSNATTTQLVNAKSKTWDWEMIGRLDLPAGLLGEIVPAGTDLGAIRPALVDDPRLEGVRVISTATHDT